ncbi:MAG: metallophosphoesterase family protein [Pseudoflavonifractor sp.]
MKILVFSDSHGALDPMRHVTAQERPNRILHLGDMVRDAIELADACPNIPVEYVRGNCDYYDAAAPLQTILMAGGKRLLMTHGHAYHVKLGMSAAVAAAREAQVDVLLFGHTHEGLCQRDNGLWVMNPGSIRGLFRPSYGLITIEDNVLTCQLREYKESEE